MILKILISILLLQQTLKYLIAYLDCESTEYSFSFLVLTWPKELCQTKG